MKLLKYLSLAAYRIPINTTILENSARDILSAATDIGALANYLQWEPDLDVLQTGFPAMRQAKDLTKKAKLNAKRLDLKKQRLQKGFTKLYGSRKGLKGWFQKKFKDPKEISLPLSAEIYEWVVESPRYALLVSLHDALLAYCSSAEPRIMSLENMSEFSDPLTLALREMDEEKLAKMEEALSSPLKNVDPGLLIDLFPGYVRRYDRDNNVAYYFGERYEH